MLLTGLFSTKDNVDLAVFGETLSAYCAVAAALKSKLSVIWVRSRNESTLGTPTGFDSLAPEGVHYLRHILSKDEIEDIRLGFFNGINRNGSYQDFDTLLGTGIHINIDTLKQVLLNLIKNRAREVELQDISLSSHTPGIELDNLSGKNVTAQWVINAQGQYSSITNQEKQYVSDDIWVSRSIEEGEGVTNSANFYQYNEHWEWIAYDGKGVKCTTRLHPKEKAPSEAFNSRWYCRKKATEAIHEGTEPRILLTGSSFFRLDPSCGLGATIQIKSALFALKAISEALKGDKRSRIRAIGWYEREMLNTYRELTTLLQRTE